jgi:hypothetical protein
MKAATYKGKDALPPAFVTAAASFGPAATFIPRDTFDTYESSNQYNIPASITGWLMLKFYHT